jgi:hypothetical protein
MSDEQKHLLAQRVRDYFGDRLLTVSKQQASILNHALDKILEDNNSKASIVTDAELDGAWEIMEEVYGDFWVEAHRQSEES